MFLKSLLCVIIFVAVNAYNPSLPYIEGVKDVFCPSGFLCRFFYVTYVPPYIFDKSYMTSQPQGLLDDALSYCSVILGRVGVNLTGSSMTLMSKLIERTNPHYAMDCGRAFASSDIAVQFSPEFVGKSSNMDVKAKTSGERLQSHEIYLDISFNSDAKRNKRDISIFIEMLLPRKPMNTAKDCCNVKLYFSGYMFLAFIETCHVVCPDDKGTSWEPIESVQVDPQTDATIKNFHSIYSPFDVPQNPMKHPDRSYGTRMISDNNVNSNSSKKKKEPNWYLCFVILGVLFLLLSVISIFAIILLCLIHADRKRVQKAVAKRSVIIASVENGEPPGADGISETPIEPTERSKKKVGDA